MALRLFLVLVATCYIICMVKSAPSLINSQIETVAFSLSTNQEPGTINDRDLETTSSNNGSKVSSVNNKLTPPETYDIDQKMNDTGEVMKAEDMKLPVVSGVRKAGPQSNVMALSDDVITDALFANIDTLQDHLEVCEEGLRQQLRHRSHGKLLQDVAAEEVDYKPEKDDLKTVGKDNKERSDLKTENEDDTEDDKDEDYENGDDKLDSAEDADEVTTNGENDDVNNDGKDIDSQNLLSPSAYTGQQSRRRRSVRKTSEEGLSLPKVDALAQNVVSRLSDRLEYLRMSLVQCHLLNRQFELLES